MAKIVVLGGTGYAGRHIVAEGVSRGHAMIALSRSEPKNPVAGAAYLQGSALDLDSVAPALEGADAVVSALSPRGDMQNSVVEALDSLANRLTGTETRLGVIGGAGGSLVAPGGPRLFDDGFPEEYKHEAQVGIDSLALLETKSADLDWFLVHPPEVFGPWAEGARTGHYRDGGAVIVRDAEGKSSISGADFAVAVIDEIEQGNHRRERFAVGY